MRVNLDDREIKYYINGEFVASIENLEDNIYVPGVYLFCCDSQIQLLQ